MTDYFVDPNRGDDSKNGIGQANAVKTLLRLAALGPNPGGGGGIYLASDGVHTLTGSRTSAANSRCGLFLFNGSSASSRAFLSSYDPAGASAQKPQVRALWYPTPSDWVWDATVQNGYPMGWYIPHTWNALGWNMYVKVGVNFAVTTNQGTANGGTINVTENGMTQDTLRYNADSQVSGSHRLWLSGAGLSAAVDPSTYFGAGQIAIGNKAFLIQECGNYSVVEDIDFTGGTLVNYQSAAADKQMIGITTRNLTVNGSADCLILGSTSTGTPLMDVDIYGNDFRNLTGPAVMAYGKGVAGRIHHNNVVGGNIAAAQGASFYIVADSLSRSIDIEYNSGDDIRNGAGNCTFDGSFAYADSGATNVRIRWNFCKNSYKAFQLNHGKYGELVGNVTYNCDVFATCTDADLKGTSDYRVANNTHYGTQGMRGFPRGVHSDQFTNAPLTFTAASGALVGVTAVNNLIVSPGGTSSNAAIRALTTALYASKVTIANNAVVGFAAESIQDWNSAGHTSGSGTITSDPAFMDAASGDLRVKTTSPMLGAGVTSALSTSDFKGRAFGVVPAIGAYERDPFVTVQNVLI